MAFDIAVREREGVQIADLKGRLLLGESSAELRNKLRELQEGGTTQIVLNLAGVDYIDSTGLGTLVMGATSIKKAGGALKLLNLSKRNIELMVMTKLTTVFEVFDDETAAVNSFFGDREVKKFDILEFVRGNQDR
jgi:anti-sigma B factor antagonist